MADEYIMRQDAFAAAKKIGREDYDRGGTYGAVTAMLITDELRAIPSADVAPVRHGRWLETTQPMGWDDVTCAECSECGEDFVLDEWGMEDVKNLMHYCPNCGAKMNREG